MQLWLEMKYYLLCPKVSTLGHTSMLTWVKWAIVQSNIQWVSSWHILTLPSCSAWNRPRVLSRQTCIPQLYIIKKETFLQVPARGKKEGGRASQLKWL